MPKSMSFVPDHDQQGEVEGEKPGYLWLFVPKRACLVGETPYTYGFPLPIFQVFSRSRRRLIGRSGGRKACQHRSEPPWRTARALEGLDSSEGARFGRR